MYKIIFKIFFSKKTTSNEIISKKIISNEIIRTFKPCYDPSKFITDENEELTVKEWVQKYRKVIPTKDILWLLLRKEFMSKKDLILFVVWCAREALKLVENPDKRGVEACNVAERYANRKATREELWIARVDVRVAANAFLNISAHSVAYHVYYAAYYAADTAASTDYVAYGIATHAYSVAHHAATHASDAAAYAASESVYDATRAAQIDQLLSYFD
jgi:hypothetical protein